MANMKHKGLSQAIRDDKLIEGMNPAQAAETGYLYAIERVEFALNSIVMGMSKNIIMKEFDEDQKVAAYAGLKSFAHMLSLCGSPFANITDDMGVLDSETGTDDESVH